MGEYSRKVGNRHHVRRSALGQESSQTATTPEVGSSVAGETRHTVSEPRTLETNSTVEPDSQRSMPVELFPDDS